MQRCPSCDESVRLTRKGTLPDSPFFSSVRLATPIPGGELYRCHRCDLLFRWPRPSDADLSDLYRSVVVTTWDQAVEQRTDWRLVRELLRDELAPGARVLDVGCFSGAFVASLEGFRLYGVEPNAEARERAAARGVTLLGESIDDIPPGMRFDAIVSTDVIEHVTRPLEFFDRCVALLAPGGILVVASGNSRSLSWRFRGSGYWYCAMPDHVSFVSERWLDFAASRHGMERTWMVRYRHEPFTVVRWAKQFALNLVAAVAPGLLRRARMALGRDADHAIGWGQAKDHLVAAVRRPDPAREPAHAGSRERG